MMNLLWKKEPVVPMIPTKKSTDADLAVLALIGIVVLSLLVKSKK